MEAFISGFQEVSTTDYPGHVCSVIFLEGCNLRCRFCANSDYLEFSDKSSLNEVFTKVINNLQLIDSVMISGGEPLIQEKVVKRIINWSHEKGLKVGVETNGTFPKRLKRIINKIDFIGLDVKSVFDKDFFERVVQKKNCYNKWMESFSIVKKSNTPCEFRMTVTPSIHLLKDILHINNKIKPDTLVLQRFQKLDTVLDKELLEQDYEHCFEKILKRWSERYPNIILRFWD